MANIIQQTLFICIALLPVAIFLFIKTIDIFYTILIALFIIILFFFIIYNINPIDIIKKFNLSIYHDYVYQVDKIFLIFLYGILLPICVYFLFQYLKKIKKTQEDYLNILKEQESQVSVLCDTYKSLIEKDNYRILAIEVGFFVLVAICFLSYIGFNGSIKTDVVSIEMTAKEKNNDDKSNSYLSESKNISKQIQYFDHLDNLPCTVEGDIKTLEYINHGNTNLYKTSKKYLYPILGVLYLASDLQLYGYSREAIANDLLELTYTLREIAKDNNLEKSEVAKLKEALKNSRNNLLRRYNVIHNEKLIKYQESNTDNPIIELLSQQMIDDQKNRYSWCKELSTEAIKAKDFSDYSSLDSSHPVQLTSYFYHISSYMSIWYNKDIVGALYIMENYYKEHKIEDRDIEMNISNFQAMILEKELSDDENAKDLYKKTSKRATDNLKLFNEKKEGCKPDQECYKVREKLLLRYNYAQNNSSSKYAVLLASSDNLSPSDIIEAREYAKNAYQFSEAHFHESPHIEFFQRKGFANRYGEVLIKTAMIDQYRPKDQKLIDLDNAEALFNKAIDLNDDYDKYYKNDDDDKIKIIKYRHKLNAIEDKKQYVDNIKTLKKYRKSIMAMKN